MEYLNGFEKLKVLQVAHVFVLEIYKATKQFPADERYALIDQIRRSASSIPANIVEGNERNTKKEYIQFLYIAKGSLAETRYHLLLAKDLGYITDEKYKMLILKAIEISKMLVALIGYLKK